MSKHAYKNSDTGLDTVRQAIGRVRVMLTGVTIGIGIVSMSGPAAQAAPIYVAPLSEIGLRNDVANVQYRQRRVIYRRSNNGVPAAILGAMALGIGAAIVSSQREERYNYGYPAYAYPQAGYGYGAAPYYAPSPYYGGYAPYYEQGAPQWQGRNRGNYWQRKAREANDHRY